MMAFFDQLPAAATAATASAPTTHGG
jgi:hypothetical protein